MQMYKTCVAAFSILLFSINTFADSFYFDSFDSDDSSFSGGSSEPASYSSNYIPRNSYSQRNYNPPKRQRVYTQSIGDDDDSNYYDSSYSRLPRRISSYGEPVIIVDPHVHAWGAYTGEGILLRSGLASAGSNWCSDLGRSCRTKSGSFRIYSLGDGDCVSKKFPLGEGGAPMPFCMYFNGGQGLHGSNEVVSGNVSHGCVRMHVSDAMWLRFKFARVGTKVIVRSY